MPSVGTAVGYIHDWSPDRAVAVSPGDAEALAGSLLDLLRRPDRRAALADAACDWALRYDANWTAATIEKLYEGMARSPR